MAIFMAAVLNVSLATSIVKNSLPTHFHKHCLDSEYHTEVGSLIVSRKLVPIHFVRLFGEGLHENNIASMIDIVGAGALNYIILFIFICLPRLKEIG